jgi:hypothetical protein
MTTNFTDDNLHNMSNEEIRLKFIELSRAYQRINKHGDVNIVKKRGRKPVSPEHKQATYERTLAKKKEKRIQKAKEEGRVYSIGRPIKIPSTQISV